MTGRLCEPEHFSFYNFPYKKDRYGISVLIGRKVTGFDYGDYTDNFTFSVEGSNRAYEYLLKRFWRYIGAM